jgi:isopentenyl phosphate kinase
LDDRVTVVKLGGSILSDKTVDFSYRGAVVKSLAKVMASSEQKVVVVHGGGAFGHPVAKRFHLSSSRPSASPEGVSETRRVMFELDARVCESLIAGGVEPYAFSPFPLLAAAGKKGVSWLEEMLRSGLTPVTFGDVVQTKGGFKILSGDTISLALSRSLRASRCIFVMDVDGILDPEGRVIRYVDRGRVRGLLGRRSSDATGGIGFKVSEALRIASSGTEVAFVSGFKPAEFSKALKRLSFHGTIVRVPSRD